MAVAERVYASIEMGDADLEAEAVATLRQVHGIHGLRLMRDAVDLDVDSITPDVVIAGEADDKVSISYRSAEGEAFTDVVDRVGASVTTALSTLAVRKLRFPLEAQSSRPDLDSLLPYTGERPNVLANPFPWIAENPFMSRILERSPGYHGILNFLGNERGLFLKVGNYPDERSHWNSTTNGGLPVFKKTDPIHEGTFMWHDLLHFVPVDPIPGAEGVLDEQHQAAYVAHRLLSEASTLVLADMVGVADAGLKEEGYDVAKRRIFPIYDSIVQAQGGVPDIRQLLTANAYFCFTGDPRGFKNMGASDEALETFRGKYGSIFRNDFMWNLGNVKAMAEESRNNPLIREYHTWLEQNTSAPTMSSFDQNGIITPDTAGLDMERMLGGFYAQFSEAFDYDEPLDEVKRMKLAAQKYLAGQRIVFSRYGQELEATPFMSAFDDGFAGLAEAKDPQVVSALLQTANGSVDSYLSSLHEKGIILPHELKLNRFTAPLYPIRFVNYDKDRDPTKSFEDEMNEIFELSASQLAGLLGFKTDRDMLQELYSKTQKELMLAV